MASPVYERGNISVDQSFARFGGKSYAIDKINSVEVRREAATNNAWVWLAVLAAFFLLAGLNGPSAGTLVVAGLLAAAVFYKFKNPNLDKYRLFLMTSSSEAQAFETTDRDDIQNLRQAIEEAMAVKSA